MVADLNVLEDPNCFVLRVCSILLPPQEWFTVYEHNRRTNCTSSDLIMGNEYMFRVYSENLCGMSDEPCQGKNTAKIAKTGL